jgi:hypothetical protein
LTSVSCAPVFETTVSSNDKKAVRIDLTAQSKFGTNGTVTGAGFFNVTKG